ncbi:hypothetical protein SMGD1_2097 [Sulfurimonas gotlandica GD1]|uniref:SHOCT domain-containing protein n=1 Tax=Sulfurimonas gotlandica (strain DSM 19862 / JCM 16533 / GD1) TaxID=929558 RepID=H1FXC4_SULGG|nr:hypothetical protein [Sulfurimonas gotlandica]EHP30620.1 hypothetical protein SMGD1_2097 [Sulfurimonas gotlandica GD1]
MKTPTNVQGMDANAMDGVYNEAILFFIIFATMSIISLIISKRNAKKYEQEHSIKERKDAKIKDELIQKHLNSSSIKIMGKKTKNEELLNKLNNGAINKEEYKILKDHLDSI